jgi:hypothetical protein
MTYKPTILNISATALIIGCVIYAICNNKALAASEGWGTLYLLGLCCFGIIVLIADVFIQIFFNDTPSLRNFIEIIILILSVVFLLL